MSTGFQEMESRWMSGAGAERRRQNASVSVGDSACVRGVSKEIAAHLLQRNSGRLRNWTHQVPLEVQWQSRAENRTGSNSIESEHKPFGNLLKPMQPSNYCPSPLTSLLSSRKASSLDDLDHRDQARLKARVREIK